MASLFLMIWVAVSLVQNPKLFTTAPKDIQAAAVPHKRGTREKAKVSIYMITYPS